jgi:uncharacterized protein YegJ (DUF2314 family)
MAESMRFDYAVYMLPIPAEDPSTVLHQALATKFHELKLVDEMPKQPREMLVHAHTKRNVQQEYPPPTPDKMKYFARDVSSEQAQAVQTSSEAFIVEFGHPREKVWAGLRNANSLIETIARATKGLIWDEETRQLYSPEAWHKERLDSWKSDPPDVSEQMEIQIYQNGEYARAISMGMSKFGLPDVFVEASPWSSRNQVANLIDAFCQSMADGATFVDSAKYHLDLTSVKNFKINDLKSDATHSACLSLKSGKAEEGDPKNRLIELAFDRYPGPDPHAKEEAMFSSLFGSEDSIRHVKHTDELLEASRKARTKLPELRKAFTAGLEPGEFIELKAPFPTPDGGNEWMWVEVTSWKGDRIKGTLLNDAFEARNLHAGEIVAVRQEDIFDYIRQYPDKHQEGNTTSAILKKMDNGTSASSQSSQRVEDPCLP